MFISHRCWALWAGHCPGHGGTAEDQIHGGPSLVEQPSQGRCFHSISTQQVRVCRDHTRFVCVFQSGFCISFQPIMDTVKPKLAPLNEGGTAELLNKVTATVWLALRSVCRGHTAQDRRKREGREGRLGLWSPDSHRPTAVVCFVVPAGPEEGVLTF